MTITTITNQKGGVGKTTTAHYLGLGLAAKGYAVLLVDADPQTNLSFNLGVVEDGSATLASVFKGESSTLDAITHTAHGVDLLKGSLDLAGADMEYTQLGRERMISEALEPVKENYDFILIDTPPALGILTVNALTASNDVIVTMETSINAIQGLTQLAKTVKDVQKYSNPDLRIIGLLMTRYNPRTILSRELTKNIEGIAAQLETCVFEQTIRDAVAIRTAQTLRENIYTEYSKEKVTQDYRAFTAEYMEKEGF